MINILTYDQIDPQQWSELVVSSPVATRFQTPEAYRFYQSVCDMQAFAYGVAEVECKVESVKCKVEENFLAEGSEIIQLFGRGVRLKGYKYSLKRSTALDSSYNPGNLPKGLREIETLNIFGVRADYMDTFRKYLEDEGLPANEEAYTEVKIPTVNLLGETKLKVVRLKEGYDFKKAVVVHPEDCIDKVRVKVDWLPKVDALWSRKAGVEEGAVMPKGKLRSNHLALLNWNKIFF